MTASPGGKATHDNLDAPKLAVLQRGGMRLHASGYPAQRRATRDLLRRRQCANVEQMPLTGVVCLLTSRGLIRFRSTLT
jgi:hypothetical protein